MNDPFEDDWDWESDTKTWTVDPDLLDRAGKRTEDDDAPISSARARVARAPAASASFGVLVDITCVRRLYECFVRIMGPVAGRIFESELRYLGLMPNAMTGDDFERLVLRLCGRLPIASARARFLAALEEHGRATMAGRR